MKGEHPSTELLSRLHDGELPHREAAELRQHLATCSDCAAYVASLTRLGQFVNLASEAAVEAAPEPDFTRMFAEIERAIASPSPVAEESPRVVPIRTQRDPSRRPVANRWWHRGAPALGAVALAAAALLMVYKQSTIPSEVSETSSYEAMATTGHSEVVAVDFGSNGGQVFDIPMSDGTTTPVVWIDDDDDEEEE